MGDPILEKMAKKRSATGAALNFAKANRRACLTTRALTGSRERSYASSSRTCKRSTPMIRNKAGKS